jgi:putative addiction module component (TIGR02574 family)
MPHPVNDLDISALSIEERAVLAHQLWRSVHDEVESRPLRSEQWAEVERRVAEADAERMPTIS